MFNKRSVYFLGIALLLLGLLWIHSGHLLHHSEISEKDNMDKEMEYSDHNMKNDNHDINLKFSLMGLFPTLLGIFLIDKHNRSLGRH